MGRTLQEILDNMPLEERKVIEDRAREIMKRTSKGCNPPAKRGD